MKTLKTKLLTLALSSVLALGGTVSAQTTQDKTAAIVGNLKGVPATVSVNGRTQQSTLNGALRLSVPEGSPYGLKLEELHLFGSSVAVLLTGQTKASPSGVISVRMTSATPLQYDGKGGFTGQFAASLHYPLIDQLKGWTAAGPTEERDDLQSFTERIRGTIVGKFDRPLPGDLSQQKEIKISSADIWLDPINPLLAKISIRAKLVPFSLSVLPWNGSACPGFVRQLCIQPVGIKDDEADPFPTGTALPALLAEAREMWGRVCVDFVASDFRHVVNSSWKTLTAGTVVDGSYEASEEEMDLLDSGVDTDCVEVFFIRRWTSTGDNGGGVTFSGGEAGAKIITSDQNDNGIDLNHLAHELGHALDLKHPGSGCPGEDCWDRIDGTPGTVMCPSGYLNDNPDIQSEENGRNANNPLVTFTRIRCCGDPDCANADDCGDCP